MKRKKNDKNRVSHQFECCGGQVGKHTSIWMKKEYSNNNILKENITKKGRI